MSKQTALGWIASVWTMTVGFFTILWGYIRSATSAVWTAAKSATTGCWNSEAMVIKLAAGFLAATVLAVGAASFGMISWIAVPVSIAFDTATLTFALTGIHLLALTVYRLFKPVQTTAREGNSHRSQAEVRATWSVAA